MPGDGRAYGLLVVLGASHGKDRRRSVEVVLLVVLIVSSHFGTLRVGIRHRDGLGGFVFLPFRRHRSDRSVQPPENLRSINREEKYQHDDSQEESHRQVDFQVVDFS